MRVYSVTGVYPPERIGGMSEVAYNLQKYLKNEGISVVVLTSGKNNKNFPNVIRVSNNVPLFLLKTFLLFPQIKRKLNIDILHFQGNSGSGMLLWKIIYGKKFPKTITTMHTSQVREMVETRPIKINGWNVCKLSLDEYIFKYIKSPLNILLDLLVVRLSDKIINVCEDTKRCCTRDYSVPISKQSVVYNGVDYNKFTPDVQGEFVREKYDLHDNPLILFVGVFKIRKRIPNLLYAMVDIVREITNAKLLIVGGRWGYEGELGNIVSELKLENTVILAGKVADDELPAYYAAADVVAVPSSYEGFPVVVLEAMASAKPIVASKVSGIPEAVIDNETGFLVEKDNIKQLTNKILILLNDPKKREKMGKAARERVIENFDWRKIAKKYKWEYQRLLEDSD